MATDMIDNIKEPMTPAEIRRIMVQQTEKLEQMKKRDAFLSSQVVEQHSQILQARALIEIAAVLAEIRDQLMRLNLSNDKWAALP